MSTTLVPPEATTSGRPSRRRTVTKFALAALALLGIGAAATSAAWTDDAWFSGTASAATVELEGSLTSGGPWELADVVGEAVVIPPETFENMLPAEVRTVTLYLHNASSVPLSVPAGTLSATGPLFEGTNPVIVSVGALTPASPLPVDGEASVVLTLTAPDWGAADIGYQGATGDLTLQFTGTTEAP